MKVLWQISLFVIPWFFLCAGVCQADRRNSVERQKPQPHICLGLHNVDGKKVWGLPRSGICPVGHAAFGTQTRSHSFFTRAKKIASFPVCCPLPINDILANKHHWVFGECPENHVVTGVRFSCSDEVIVGRPVKEDCECEIRCTQVNPARYQLGAAKPGALWGNSSVQWQEKYHFLKMDVPASLRYALGRRSQYHWDISGCVGYPFGSLFTAKHAGRCRSQSFQRLEYLGKEGDPPQGTAVVMFPDCYALSSYMDPEPQCLNYDK